MMSTREMDSECEQGKQGAVRSSYRKWIYAALLVGTLALASFYVATLLGEYDFDARPQPSFRVDLDQPGGLVSDGTRRDPADGPSLRVAIAPVISPEKSLEIYRDLARYLAEKLARRAEVMQRATYSEINELVRYRQCDVALVCTYPFVRGEQDFGMEVLAVPKVAGEVTYHSLILVRGSSEATSLLDLRSKRFASADLLSNSGWLYPATWLLGHGEDPDSFFSDHMVVGSHDRSIQAVASGFVDGAAVDSLVYRTVLEEDPSISRRVKIIQESPPFGMPPLVVHPQLEQELKSQLREVLLSMHEDPYGKTILSSIGIDRFVLPELGIYDSVRKAALVWESR